MVSRVVARSLAGAALLPLAACQHYAPAPLRDPAAVLSPPDLAALSADAATIDRPFLRPQPIDLAQPLTPNQLAIIAVVENPDLKALRAKNGVTDAQAFAARLLPDPTLQGTFDKLLTGPDEFNGFAGQIGFDLQQLRTAKVVREGNAAKQRQVRLDLAWAEWQTAGQARLQGVRVAALEAQLAVAQASAAAAERQRAAAERAVARGDLAAIELDARRQGALDAADKARVAARDLATARVELNRQLGLPPQTMLRLAPVTAPAEPPAAEQLVTTALARRVDLAALRHGYDSAEADVHKAILDQFPTLSLALGYARDTADNRTFGPQVGFTLPLWNRNRGGIAVAKTTREQLRLEYEARLFQTRADIHVACIALETVRTQRAALATAMPAMEGHVAAMQRAARRGDLASVTVAGAEATLADRRLALLQLDQQAAEQTIALELLTGTLSEGWTS